MVDGKQYGPDIPAQVTDTKLKLSLNQRCFKVNVVAIAELPEVLSAPSNTVELQTEHFQPFAWFCLNQVHKRTANYPDVGCCIYQSSWTQEVHSQSHTALCPGPVHVHRLFPPLSAINIDSGQTVPVTGTELPGLQTSAQIAGRTDVLSKRLATVILFWTPWCKASQRYLASFMSFVAKFGNKISSITCAYDSWQALDAKTVRADLNEKGYFNFNTKHVINSSDVCDMLGIYGVPTFIFLHPNGAMAWQGRFCALSAIHLERFILHILSRVSRKPCPIGSQCTLCQPLIHVVRGAERALASKSFNLPVIRRPLEISPAFPPYVHQGYHGHQQLYDPFLARWIHYSPYRVAQRRRIPWYALASEIENSRRKRSQSCGPKKTETSDESRGRGRPRRRGQPAVNLPSLTSSKPWESSDGEYVTSRSSRPTQRVPWYQPRKSVLLRQSQRRSTSFERSDSLTSGDSLQMLKKQLDSS